MIKTWYRSTKDKKIEVIDNYRYGAWINVTNASEDDIQKITELTSLDFEDLEDSLDAYEVPRLERQDNSLLFFLRSSESKDDQDTQLLTVVVTNHYFITISTGDNTLVNTTLERNLITTQRAKLLIYFFRLIANSFTNSIKKLSYDVRKQKSSLEGIDDKEIMKLSNSEDILNQYLSTLDPMQKIFENVMTGKHIALYERDKDLLNDAYIAIQQSLNICKINLKRMHNLRESYQTILSNRLNKSMQMLTSLSVVLTIPTIVSSIYGMNIFLPLADNPNSFWLINGGAFAFAFLILLYLRSKKWI